MTHKRATQSSVGWFRQPGGDWERVAEGIDRRRIVEALLDIPEEGELLILPAGQQPSAENRGQFRRGNWPEVEGQGPAS
jgi:hypothetical protein